MADERPDESPVAKQPAADLLPEVYAELRRVAAVLSGRLRPGQTLQPTALVHEAYLRLVRNDDPGWEGRRHFFGAAARAMHDILVEQARRKASVKHGGAAERVELGEGLAVIAPPADDLLALDEAVRKLQADRPHLAELVMLRYYTGLSFEDTANVGGVGPHRAPVGRPNRRSVHRVPPRRQRVDLAFGPDGSWLIDTSSEGTRLQVWDVLTGRHLRDLTGPAHIRALALSPDGSRVPASEPEGRLSVLDVATGRAVASWPTEVNEPVRNSLAFSPDGRRLAGTGANSAVIELRDTETYRPILRLPGHTGPVNCVAFTPDGRRLASAGRDRTVRLWDATTGECLAVLRGHSDEVFGLAFHPDGRRLASAGRDRVIWLWDLAKGQDVARLHGHTNYVFSLAFSPDGKSLVSASGDGTVRLWDTEPLSRRYQARREAAALRPEAERLVGRLFREKKDDREVLAALRSDPSLSGPRLHAALRRVLRRRPK